MCLLKTLTASSRGLAQNEKKKTTRHRHQIKKICLQFSLWIVFLVTMQQVFCLIKYNNSAMNRFWEVQAVVVEGRPTGRQRSVYLEADLKLNRYRVVAAKLVAVRRWQDVRLEY